MAWFRRRGSSGGLMCEGERGVWWRNGREEEQGGSAENEIDECGLYVDLG
jgi:hypothetical protein